MPSFLDTVAQAPVQLQSIVTTLQHLAQAVNTLGTNLTAALVNVANQNG